jgi:serine phosphatase RsbU (regulator of sigma subunit)
VVDEVDACLRAFSNATSWGTAARSAPIDTVGGKPAPHLKHFQASRRWKLVDNIVRDGMLDADELSELPCVPMDQAQELLASIERLVGRLDAAEEIIRRQEAELATSVVVTSHPDRQQETADRLESILESTSRAIGAVAGAIYLLDDETTSLKMRACFGLPRSRLAQPPRELRGSLADLEALLGNAVLLSDIEMMREWPSPEEFASAIVVPVGTQTMPHGTMWFWSTKSRSYSATEVEVTNLAAGRVMGEIEQSILGHEVHQSRVVQKQMDTASLTQASMLPDNQILHEDFDIGGWTFQKGSLGGAFHHWDIVPSGMMTFALGTADQHGPEGSIVATSAHAIIKTLWNQGSSPQQILRVLNDAHWSMTDADWSTAIALFQINPVTGYGSVCNAGDIQSFIVSSRGARPIGTLRPAVGKQPDTAFTPNRFILQPGEILVSYSSNILNLKPSQPQSQPSPLDQARLLNSIRDMCDESASDIASYIARQLPSQSESKGLDHSMFIAKNIRKAFK